MIDRKSKVVWAAVAAVAAFAGAARAQNSAAKPAVTEMTLQPTYMQADAPRKPLMNLLDRVGAASPLEEYRINIGGYVEASATYYADPVEGEEQPGRLFDFENQDPTLNGIQLFVERLVDVSKGDWDVGFRLEGMWGGDARFIHSVGLFDHYGNGQDGNGGFDGSFGEDFDSPDEQFDITQAYVDVVVPVGNGLKLRAGKFVTPVGYETINPTTRPLYSVGTIFTFGIPFTHTGVVGTYALNDNWTVEGGVIRGWEGSLEDNNGSVAGLGRVIYTTTDKKWATYLTVISGPEQSDDDTHYRTLVDLIVTHTLTDDITVALEGMYAYESAGDADGSHSDWYGAGAWATWTLTDMFSVSGRLEYFNDSYGSRGLDTVVYDAALGLTITPFPTDAWTSGLKIRPEIRLDYADNAIFGGENEQLTFAIEGYYAF